MLALGVVLAVALAFFPRPAKADAGVSNATGGSAAATENAGILRTPMPVNKTFTTYKTVRSAATGGFCYVYLKVDATVEANSGSVMSVNGVYAYQADVSSNFKRWERLSLDSTHSSKTIHAKTTGYCYFSGPLGLQDKQYVEVEGTWSL